MLVKRFMMMTIGTCHLWMGLWTTLLPHPSLSMEQAPHHLPLHRLINPQHLSQYHWKDIEKRQFWDSTIGTAIGKRQFWDSTTGTAIGKRQFWDSTTGTAIGKQQLTSGNYIVWAIQIIYFMSSVSAYILVVWPLIIVDEKYFYKSNMHLLCLLL